MAVSLVLGAAAPALAHGFGRRYDLPVPLWLYVSGAAAAVAFSFVVIGLFVRGAPGVRTYPRVNLLKTPLGRVLAHPAILFLLKLFSASVFVLFMLAGILGNQFPMRNLAPTLVWVIWWVGLAYVSALAGNLWAVINPWKVLFGWAEALHRRVRRGGELSLCLPYPEALGVWPGLALFVAFSWVELVWPGRATPANLAGLAFVYSVITWTGMFLFGKERWLRHGEAFSLAFGLLARFAPTEIRVVRPEVCQACSLDCRDRDGQCTNCAECFGRAGEADRQWNLRPYAVGLLRNERVSASMMAFVLVMLSAVTFDGFMATPAWAGLERVFDALLPGLGGAGLTIIQTLGLVCFPLLFLSVYLAVSGVMRAASGGRLSTGQLARTFAFTLVPIAIAYHLAHYLSFLVIWGQLIIPLASDPFGFGWNLLGTAEYRIDNTVVGERFAWYTAVIAIVMGHIIAVFLAHALAVRSLQARVPAIRSQYAMSALMVGYTVVSLWILAQPIVESGTPSPTPAEATPSAVVWVPPDALIPEPGTGRLREVAEEQSAKVKLTYRVLTSTFQDGTRVTLADILYPYGFAFRWGVRTAQDGLAYDPSIERTTALIRERLRGVRALGVDRMARGFGELKLVQEMLIIEVYIDSPFGDPQQVASLAPPWSSLPWHVIVLMEEAVIRGWAAFSREEAQRRGVEWLDLVRGERVKAQMASLVEEFERQGYIPDSLTESLAVEEARERWAALGSFYKKYGHFLVTNGPYILEKWSEESTVLRVFRDLSYPLGVGSYDAYPIPHRAYISEVEIGESGLRIHAEVERVQKFQRTYEIVREPLRQASSGLRPREVPVCRYVVVGSDGAVLMTGLARFGEDKVFVVDLEDRLEPGSYTVLTALYLNGNYMNPDIKRVPYRVGGSS
ncbi:MAG: hypothetical protein ACE5JD_16790 [Candidatus Methylomirabilia bacterium]